MSCGICQRSQRDGFRDFECDGIDTVDTCKTGEMPKLSFENRRFMFLFNRIFPGLVGGMGGLDYGAVDTVFNIYKVKTGQRPILMDKVLVMVRAYNEVQKSERNNG